MSATIPCGVERFARQRSDARHTDWEKSPAVYWGKDLLNGLCAVFSIGVVIALLFRVMA